MAKKRPGGITFAGWLIGINAFTVCLSGIVMLFVISSNDQRLEDAGLTAGVAIVAGFVLLAIGLLLFVLVWALFDRSPAARVIVTVLLAIGLLANLRDVILLSRDAVGAWFSGAVAIGALVCLWGTPGAGEFFASQRPPRPASPAPPPPPLS